LFHETALEVQELNRMLYDPYSDFFNLRPKQRLSILEPEPPPPPATQQEIDEITRILGGNE
jgi:hypothetical protein